MQLLKTDGKKVRLPFDKLSETDRDLARKLYELSRDNTAEH